MKFFNNPLATLGEYTLSSFAEIGRVFIFSVTGIKNCFAPPFYFREIFNQLLAV
ncbi:MAG: hypothetical protein LBJ71_03250 [Holosporaceae bacterium]|nr:hypothetical protein [Holosporaceae bacterium]